MNIIPALLVVEAKSVSLFSPCLMVREFGGYSKLLTTRIVTHPDSGCGYLILLTFRWLIQVDPFHRDRLSGYANVVLLLLL